MPLDDEMPAAPASGGAASAAAAEAPVRNFSGDVDFESYDKTPEMGEPIPQGTYEFRADSYREGWGDAPKPGDKDFAYGAQPYFMLKWVAQTEPVIGRAFTDFLPWISNEVAVAAAGGDAGAQAIIQDRIWKLKTIASQAGFKPAAGSKFNAKDFLASNPVIKISLGVDKKKKKNATTGKYEATEELTNKVNAYLPLFGERK
jgi:hypothetical protein